MKYIGVLVILSNTLLVGMESGPFAFDTEQKKSEAVDSTIMSKSESKKNPSKDDAFTHEIYTKVAAGINPNTVFFEKTLPLLWAALKENIELVIFLLEHGAKSTISAPNKRFTIYFSVKNNKKIDGTKKNQILSLMRLFKEFEISDENSELKRFINGILTKTQKPSFNNIKISDRIYNVFDGLIIYLVHKGANPNIFGNHNPLFYAVTTANYDLVVFLLNHDANPDLVCTNDKLITTPFYKIKEHLNTPYAHTPQSIKLLINIYNVLFKKSYHSEEYQTDIDINKDEY